MRQVEAKAQYIRRKQLQEQTQPPSDMREKNITSEGKDQTDSQGCRQRAKRRRQMEEGAESSDDDCAGDGEPVEIRKCKAILKRHETEEVDKAEIRNSRARVKCHEENLRKKGEKRKLTLEESIQRPEEPISKAPMPGPSQERWHQEVRGLPALTITRREAPGSQEALSRFSPPSTFRKRGEHPGIRERGGYSANFWKTL